MFPLAHAWLIQRIIPTAQPVHYLGCVWPDMLFGSPLSHSESHRSGARLAEAIGALPAGPERDEFRAFVAGALSHGSEPHGFDWYSDEEYGGRPAAERGYAFQHAVSLAGDAARACGVAPEQGWWKAHNLVEMAFEQSLYLAAPQLGESLAAACADEALCHRVARVLAGVFGQPADALAGAMQRFPSVVTFTPATVRPQAETYAHQTRLKHAGSNPDVAALESLIARAQEIIAPTRDDYMATSLEAVGRMVGEVAPDALQSSD
ncbi:MAG TPA: hypothetical protein VJR48_11655 [Ktedonobacterales bacterium]|nr:hypothetical protein [Ktedonobacterales bacterium]